MIKRLPLWWLNGELNLLMVTTFLEDVLDFCKTDVEPVVDTLATDIAERRKLFDRMGSLGLFGMTLPKEFGGLESDPKIAMEVIKQISSADAGLGVCLAVTSMVAETIYQYGTDEQKQEYLPSILKGGGAPASFALTEEHAGSDAASITTKAQLVDDHYLLEGSKKYITNADLSSVTIVIARTSDEGHRGLSAFLLERDTSGFEITQEEIKLGLLTANLVNFDLKQCKLPKEQLLGELGQGFEIAMTSLDSGRLSIAAQAVGIGQAALDESLKFATHRKQFGKPLIEHAAIAQQLADLSTELSAADALLDRAIEAKMKGARYTVEAAKAKLFCTEMCNRAASTCVQIHGARGYVKGHIPERLFRDARATTIYEGTSEIQRLVIAKSLVKSQQR